MNLLILHLSDMHFIRNNTFTQNNIDNIVNALQTSMHDIAHVLIVVSGDIAFSGTNVEYGQASAF